MANKIAVLEYTFVFKTGLDTWTRAVDFESHQMRVLAAAEASVTVPPVI